MQSRLATHGLIAVTILVPLVAPAQTGCLSGNVIDNTGAPVPGIRITVGDNVWTTAQISPEPSSDEAGQFRIEGIPAGNYDANAFNDQLGYPGIWWQVRKISITDSPICTNITFNVRSRTAKLKLTVTDGTTGRRIKDILVGVFPESRPGLWLHVEPLLSYGLPPQVPSLSKLRIVVTAKGYTSSEFTFRSLAPGATQEIITTVFPKRLGCITGIAIDDSFAPVMGATIDPRFLGNANVDNQTPVQTDRRGRFRADRLRPGDYDLYPENETDGFSRLWVGWLNQPALPKLLRVTVPATGTCQNVTVNMGPRGAWLNVIAIDANTQETLSRRAITIMNSARARQGGSFNQDEPKEVLVPAHASFTAQVRAEGYRSSEPVQIDPLIPGEKKTLTVPLQREAAPQF